MFIKLVFIDFLILLMQNLDNVIKHSNHFLTCLLKFHSTARNFISVIFRSLRHREVLQCTPYKNKTI